MTSTTIGSKADQQAVLGVLKGVYEAWEANDAEAFVADYLDDASVVQPGVYKKDRQEIQSSMAGAFAGPLKGSRVIDQPQDVRFLNEDTAIVISEGGIVFPEQNSVPIEGMVRATWEDTVVAIAGARMGKTTSMAVPQVLDAPGVAYCTSNKRDLLDLTRKAREKRGQVWVFDPQGIAGTTTPSFWWDPLDAASDIASARLIADVFASASRPPNATRDSYFDPAGEELLATYLLAAAAGKEPITAVYAWLTNDRDDTPVAHLKDAGHLDLSAAAEAAAEALARRPTRPRGSVVWAGRRASGGCSPRRSAGRSPGSYRSPPSR